MVKITQSIAFLLATLIVLCVLLALVWIDNEKLLKENLELKSDMAFVGSVGTCGYCHGR